MLTTVVDALVAFLPAVLRLAADLLPVVSSLS